MPSVIAGVIFCWMFYKWLDKVAGPLPALIGLLFVALLPPIVLIAAEVRQYSLLLAFLACAIYFLDKSIAENSPRGMATFSLLLYLAMFSHYSAFFFAAALGIYVLVYFITRLPRASLLATWALGQLGAVALALFFYKTHISKLGAGESRTVTQGWMSEFYLRHSYFDRAHDNPLTFVIAHTFGVFQYIFRQLAVGDVMALLFLAAIVLLLRGRRGPRAHPHSSRQLALFLLLPFAVAAAVSLAHVYPYGGTRHIAFLVIPAIAGVSIAIAELLSNRWTRAFPVALVILCACLIFGKARQPRMDRSDQNHSHMADAIEFVNRDMNPSDLIFTDYQTDLILGHYLCRQQPITFEAAPSNFEQFSCAGHRVAATNFLDWMFTAENFPRAWQRLIQDYSLKPGTTVWIFQAGWDIDLPEDLQKHFAELHDLPFQSFGTNIKVFKLRGPRANVSVRRRTVTRPLAALRIRRSAL